MQSGKKKSKRREMGARTIFNLDKLLYNADGGGGGEMCFLSFPLSLLSFVSNLHFLPLSLTNCLPSLPSFQFIGGSNTDARLFANGIVLL